MKKFYFSLMLLFGLLAINMNAQSTRTIYLDATLWAADDPVFMVHVWNTGDEDAADYTFEAVVDAANIYSAEIRNDAAHAIFVRKNPEGDMSVIWNDAWNRAYTDIPADKNLFTVTAWEGGDAENPCIGEWSQYGEETIVPQPEEGDKVIVKVLKPETWDVIYAYEYADGKQDVNLLGAWPGAQLQDLGNGWYGLAVPAEANLILNNGSSDEQANDYYITAAVCLEGVANEQDVTVSTNCADVPDPQEGVIPEPQPVNDVAIKVRKLDTWSTMNIWAWGSADATFMAQFTAWPGVAMQDLGNGWYGFTVKSDAWFIVNNGDGSEQTQAAQATEEGCYEVGTDKNGEGHYAINSATCPSEASAIESVIADDSKKAVKRIMEGQIVLIRDGKVYNALGVQMK